MLALKEKLSFSAPLERISWKTVGKGNLQDQQAKSAGSLRGLGQDQLRCCPVQWSECAGANLCPAVPAGTRRAHPSPWPLPSSQSQPLWLFSTELCYLSAAGSKTPPLAFTTGAMPRERAMGQPGRWQDWGGSVAPRQAQGMEQGVWQSCCLETWWSPPSSEDECF